MQTSSRSTLLNGCNPKKRKMCVSVVVLAVLIGSILFAYKAFGDKPKDPYLKKVFIVFRHGDRNPTETYPNDPYINYSWPGGWGALTKRGMLQMYGLGAWLQEEFGYLTSNKYLASATMVNSSYSDRCQESAQAFLAGFFAESSKTDGFIPELHWRPVPVHYLPRSLDKILVVGKKCPKLEASLAQAYQNESLNSDEKLKSYYEEISRITGQRIKTITDIEFLYNTLEIEVMNGLELPRDIKAYYNETMREIAARSYTLFTSDLVQRRLRGGPLLKDVLDHMMNDKSPKKIFLYASHDVNLVNSLRAMGFTQEHYEFYKLDVGATLVFELRVGSGGQTQEVKISKIKSAESRSFEELKIPGCQAGTCKLEELTRVWKDVLPQDWETECNT